MDYFDLKNQESPTAGDLLIANPMMGDEIFERALIYICEHGEEGSLGYVLNRPANITVSEVMEDFSQTDAPLFLGGPVEQNSLHFLYRAVPDTMLAQPLENTRHITRDLYTGGSYNELKLLEMQGAFEEVDIKFFIGYSGWAEGQLEKEIEENSWVVVKNPDLSYIFNSTDRAHWGSVMKALGGRYRMMANYPVDPRHN